VPGAPAPSGIAWSCTEGATTLNPGDTLPLYSDGVTEAGADSGDEFGEDRLIHALRVNPAQSAEALVQAIVDDVNEFSGAARNDDPTVVALRGLSCVGLTPRSARVPLDPLLTSIRGNPMAPDRVPPLPLRSQVLTRWFSLRKPLRNSLILRRTTVA